MKALSRILAWGLILALTLSLGGTAFADRLTLPSSLKTIEEEAFMGDSSLDEVVIPSGVTAIPQKAFANSSLRAIHIPASVKSIASDAFAGTKPVYYLESPACFAGKLNSKGTVHLTKNATISGTVSFSNTTLIVDAGVTVTVKGTLQGSRLILNGTLVNRGTLKVTESVTTEGSGLLSIPAGSAQTQLPQESYFAPLNIMQGDGVPVTLTGGAAPITAISQGDSTAEITAGGESVRLCFVPRQTGEYTLFSSGDEDSLCTLYNASGEQIAYNDDGGENRNFSLSFFMTANTVYYYEVRYYNADTTGTISLTLAGEAVTVTPISVGAAAVEISGGGSVAWLSFVPKKSGSYTLSSTGIEDTMGTLLDASGSQLVYNDDGGEGHNFSITYDFVADTLYFFEVRYYNTSLMGTISLVLSPNFAVDAAVTAHPADMTVKPNATATFRVTATGHSLSYQWQQLRSGSERWEDSTLSGCKTAKLSFKALASHDGWQFRCIVTGQDGIPLMTDPARLYVTSDSTRYRALLISEVAFDPICNRNEGDVQLMKTMLQNVRGPSGGRYTITTGRDYTPEQVKNAIAQTFAGATSQDVSLFFIATHGDVYYGAGSPYAGALATSTGGSILFGDLAGWLGTIPGKVIVVVESCGSGAAIYAGNDVTAASALTDEAFAQALIEAFEEEDVGVASVSPNTGELRVANKFYVLTASALQQESWGTESGPYNYFTKWLTDGVGTSGVLPADVNYGDKDGVVTLEELYRCISAVGDSYPFYSDSGISYQTVKRYPENSAEQLFKR